MKDDSEQKSILFDVTTLIADQNVDLSTVYDSAPSSDGKSSDGIYAYTSETLSLGLLFLEFKDGIREGDGNHIMLVWKYLLLFKAAKHTNYAIEALTLLSQYHLILPPCITEQLKWSLCINTQGLPGHNISCNLHMEHLNRVAKMAVNGLGANKFEDSIKRVGKAIVTITTTLDNFNEICNMPNESGKNSKQSNEKDFYKVINQLVKCRMFDVRPGRKHKSFAN